MTQKHQTLYKTNV